MLLVNSNRYSWAQKFSATEHDGIFGDNCARFYLVDGKRGC